MVKRFATLALIAMAAILVSCNSQKPTYVLPMQGKVVERKPLVVPHRDWFAKGCYPERRYHTDTGWREEMRCRIN